MARHHYLGKGRLCGAQVRYLIRSSARGAVGAASFSSAAWKVAVRDGWIGWSPELRVRNLSRVVANSRFLILPHVRVPHLASHVLGQLVKRLPRDWEATTGERPLLLETFVEEARFSGTCYRAAGWTEIGRTAGLGRQGKGAPVKKVLVYPLSTEARSLLRGGEPVFEKPCPVLPPPADWAEEEFRGVPLPDQRLVARLLTLARDFFARPAAQLPQACGSRAKTKAAYRFFDQEKVTMKTLLSAHTKKTEERLAAHPVVLCVQDTTDGRVFGEKRRRGTRDRNSLEGNPAARRPGRHVDNFYRPPKSSHIFRAHKTEIRVKIRPEVGVYPSELACRAFFPQSPVAFSILWGGPSARSSNSKQPIPHSPAMIAYSGEGERPESVFSFNQNGCSGSTRICSLYYL